MICLGKTIQRGQYATRFKRNTILFITRKYDPDSKIKGNKETKIFPKMNE
jgi:hypothetical protein